MTRTEYATISRGAHEAYRSLARAAEMSLDEVLELAAADRLSVAAKRAEQRRKRSDTIKRLMYTRALKDGPIPRSGP